MVQVSMPPDRPWYTLPTTYIPDGLTPAAAASGCVSVTSYLFFGLARDILLLYHLVFPGKACLSAHST